MKPGNMRLLAVSAVIVALVLVFSYVTLGEDRGAGEARDEPAIGDINTYEFTETGPDGTVTGIYTEFVTGYEPGTGLFTVTYLIDGQYRSMEMLTSEELTFGETPEGWVLTGTESIDTVFGTVECDVYEYADDTFSDRYWISGSILYRSEHVEGDESWVNVLRDTTLLDPEPPVLKEGVPVGEPEVGDWVFASSYYQDQDGNTAVMGYKKTVTAIDGDTCSVFYDSLNGDQFTRQYALTDFAGAPEGSELIGYTLWKYMGDYILCDVYGWTQDGSDFIMYVSNGFGYAVFQNTESGYDIVMEAGDSSLLGGAGQEWRQDVGVGDNLTYRCIYEVGGETIESVQVITVVAVLDDGRLCVEYDVDGVKTRQIMTLEEFVGGSDNSTVFYPAGSEVLDTPFGERRCTVYSYTEGPAECKIWFDNNVAYKTETTEDGMTTTIFLESNTMLQPAAPEFQPGPAPRDPEVGDTIVYTHNEYNDGQLVESLLLTQTVLAVDGDSVDARIDLEGYDPFVRTATKAAFIGAPADAAVIGTALYRGEIPCTVVTYETDGLPTYALVSNGLAYLYVIDSGDGVYEVQVLKETSLLG